MYLVWGLAKPIPGQGSSAPPACSWDWDTAMEGHHWKELLLLPGLVELGDGSAALRKPGLPEVQQINVQV